MFKSILVPTLGLTSDPAALETALLIARTFTGHIDCVHIRRDPAQRIMDAARYDLGIGTGAEGIVGDLTERYREEDQRRSSHAQKLYAAFCTRENLVVTNVPKSGAGASASWREVIGREEDILIAEAHVHDLTVLGHAVHIGGLTREIVGSVLIGSGRPLLLAPIKTPETLTDTIVIAWKDRPEAAHAVGGAIPLLEKAKKVVIVSVAEDEEPTVGSPEALANNLRWHGIDVEIRHITHPVGPEYYTIIELTKELSASLLVLGGYGHSRLSEYIFGGVTRDILADAPLPVLIAH